MLFIILLFEMPALYFFSRSEVESSGPKGLLKSDVLAHIAKKGLQPIKPKEEGVKAASAAPAPARKEPKPT